MRIVITERDGSIATIFAYDDTGKELYQTRRDITDDLKDAVKTKRSLEEVVAKKLGASYETPEEPSREARVVTVEKMAKHEHPEYLHLMPEHEHDRAAGTERDVLVAVSRVEQFTAKVQESLRTHGHEPTPHTHDEVQPHRHDHTHVDILEPVSQMQGLIAELSNSVASLGRVQSQERILTALAEAEAAIEELKAHQHPHVHDDLRAAVDALGADITKTNARVNNSIGSAADELRAELRQHAHPAEAHDHPHAHEALIGIIKGLESRLEVVALSTGSGPHSHSETADALQSVWEGIAAANKRPAPPHDHPHNHADLENRIEEAATKVGAHEHGIPQHEHVHNHPAAEHAVQGLTDEVTRLNAVVATLQRRLDAHEHEAKLVPHEHDYLKEVPVHEHPKAEVRQQHWIVLSEQEVAGKRRLVVEESV